MSEWPAPVEPLDPLGAFPPPPPRRERPESPVWVPPDGDAAYGAEAAAAELAARLERVQPAAARLGEDGRPVLQPPFALRDHVDGPVSAPVTLLVFGAYGTRGSRTLGTVLDRVRERHLATVRFAWRHFPDPAAHPHAAVFALAAEAAAARGRFWGLTRELLRMRHGDPRDLHDTLVRAGLDPEPMLAAMRAGTGADRIVADAASALSSGVLATPALFIDGRTYRDELDAAAVSAALERAGARPNAG